MHSPSTIEGTKKIECIRSSTIDDLTLLNSVTGVYKRFVHSPSCRLCLRPKSGRNHSPPSQSQYLVARDKNNYRREDQSIFLSWESTPPPPPANISEASACHTERRKAKREERELLQGLNYLTGGWGSGSWSQFKLVIRTIK
jgi:hypothetical protein